MTHRNNMSISSQKYLSIKLLRNIIIKITKLVKSQKVEDPYSFLFSSPIFLKKKASIRFTAQPKKNHTIKAKTDTDLNDADKKGNAITTKAKQILNITK
jgi:hypothetical protein